MPIEVPSMPEFDALAGRVTTLEGASEDATLADRVTALEAHYANEVVPAIADLDIAVDELETTSTNHGAGLANVESDVLVLGATYTALADRVITLEQIGAPEVTQAELDVLISAVNTLASGITETETELGTLQDRVTALENATPPTGSGQPGVIVVNGFNDAAVAAAFSKLTYTGNVVNEEIYFPRGTYNLSNSIFYTPDGNTRMLEGLTIRGAGKRRTKVNFSGTSGNPLFRAIKALRFFRLEGFSFYSTSLNNTFCYGFSDVAGGGYNQRWTIEDVEWHGKWKHIFALDGDEDANLNSEMSFIRCETSTTAEFGEAFFELGAIDGVADNQENQFLNYFFYDCNLTLLTGTVFRINKGGSIRVINGSWSAASKTGGPITWFHMPRTNYNNRSAAQLSIQGVRFEPKAAEHVVLDCGWNTGTVSFTDCIDLSSSQNDASKAYTLYRVTGGSPWGKGEMPIITFTRHQGVGYHSYDGPAVNGGGGFIYEGSYFFRGTGGQRALPTQEQGADSVLRWTSGKPQFAFEKNHNVDSLANWR